MNLTETFGFDEMFSGVAGAFPEIKLHVRRSGDQTFASAESQGLLGVGIGKAGDSVGPVVRRALVDLQTRLVVRDNSTTQAAATLAAREVTELERVSRDISLCEERCSQLDSQIDDSRWELSALSEGLVDVAVDELDEHMSKMRTLRLTLGELEAQLVSEEAKLGTLQDRLADLEDADDDDFDDDFGDDSSDEW